MIPILYDSTEEVFDSNGLGRLHDVTSVRVSEERNGIYECDFTIPAGSANFDKIQLGRIIGVTHDETGDIQPFDIVSMSRPISGLVTFHAVHISYRLSGIVCAYYGTINSLSEAIGMLTQQSVPSENMKFHISSDFSASGYAAAFDGVPRSVRQFLGGIEGSVLDTYGGEYRFDRWNVTLHKHRGKDRTLTIRYGLNMLDFTDEQNSNGTFSAAVAYWKGNDGAGNDVVAVSGPFYSGQKTVSGRDDCAALDLSDKFETWPDDDQLEAAAIAYMKSKQTHVPAQTINVDFVRLQDAGYEWYEPLLRCELCDTVMVEFPRYGMQGRYKIVKTEWDVLAGRYTSMELGQLSTSLSEALGISNSAETLNRLDNLSIAGDAAIGGDLSVLGDLFLAGSHIIDGVSDEGGTGTQDNWHYIKLANGIAACWRRWNQSGVNINQSAGQLRYATLGTIDNYPVTFRYNPVVLFSGSVTNGNGWVSNNRSNQTTTNCGGFFAYSYANQSSAVVTVNILAIGRWKAS